MVFKKLLRQLMRRPQTRTIDLIASDRMALGNKIANLGEEQCKALHWSKDDQHELFEALMAASPKGYDGWHPTEEELFAATLTPSEWSMIERLCSELVSSESDGWPSRVLSRIRASAAPRSISCRKTQSRGNLSGPIGPCRPPNGNSGSAR